ncbi:hypothetical protein [uncultured Ruegeria sp.]|uniref:hypothetical protein n=1 Tax=uncultured Ruegeria sp. TaxID=259304 RepID=UPI00262F0076|nr:hypothetical protein [uncultured Ruegeria sp.]
MHILTIVLTTVGTFVFFGLIAIFIFRSEEKKTIKPNSDSPNSSDTIHGAHFGD